MRKIIVVMMLLALNTSVNASDISWGNTIEIFKASGATDLVLDGDTSYFIRLYESVDSTINFSIISGAINLGADDTYTGIQFNWNTGGLDGYCYWDIFNADTTYGVNAGDKFYSVLFDTSLVDGNCAIVDASVATANYPGANMTYDPGGVVGGMQGSGGDWQAIPEPATAMLLAIGGGVAWLIRLKQRFC